MSDPWMSAAWSHVGVTETPGSRATPAIVEMFAKSGHAGVKSDEVPWCAAFVGACLADAGLPTTNSLMARSYLKYGTELDAPQVGCIAVLKRGQPPSGHVGFVTGWDNGRIRLLGGNQSNKVCEQSYPIADVLGYRWPPVPTVSTVATPNPLPQSGTVWGSITAALAGVAAYVNETLAGLLEWAGKLTEFAPVSAAFASMGGNVKSITLGLGVGAAVYVISRRVKAAQEGKPG
jgi:uncharacterized protein (TIGR02594 family)